MFTQNGKINEEITLAIGLKYNQIKRDALPNLEVDHFIDYLFKHSFKKNVPKTLTDAVILIMNADVENIVVYLSNSALVNSKNTSLDEFGDLFE